MGTVFVAAPKLHYCFIEFSFSFFVDMRLESFCLPYKGAALG
jgi:hypothetical protein